MARDVGAGEPHAAARARPQKRRVQGDAGIFQSLRRRPRCRSRGRDGTGCRASPAAPSAVGVPEAAGLEQGGGDRPSAEQEILQPGPERCGAAWRSVIGDVARAFGDDVEIEMVLEIRADAGQIVDHRHADRFQMIRRADARQHQQPRRADRAGGERSPRARRGRCRGAVLSAISTPTARPLLDHDPRARCAPVRTVRLGRCARPAANRRRRRRSAAHCAPSPGNGRRPPGARR